MKLAWLGILCASCDSPPDTETFPYCVDCVAALSPAPRLCATCFGHHAESNCPNEFLATEGEDGSRRLDSLSAAYLLVGGGHRALRAWKKTPTWLIERRLWDSFPALPNVDAIVPIPQTSRRSWRMGGGPPRRLARHLSRRFGVPALDALAKTERETRQGMTRGGGRLGRDLGLSVRGVSFDRVLGARVLLVDDFVTSGETVRQGAQALRRAGAREVHVLGLAFRPAISAARRSP